MKLRKVWVAGALAAFTLGIGAEACATGSAMDSADGGTTAGTNCATLSACCMTLTTMEAAQCSTALTEGDDTGCGTFLATIKQAGLCVAATSSSSSGVGISTGSAVAASTSAAVGMDSGMSSSTGSTNAATTSSSTSTATGTSTSTGSSSGTGTGVGGSIPTTCAKANDAIGCCGPNGKVYYCTGSGTGSSVSEKTCASGTTCGWDTAKGYYYCVATPGTAPSGDPIACE